MDSDLPIIRQISWLSVIMQLLTAGLLIIIFGYFNRLEILLPVLLLYLTFTLYIKMEITRFHRKGMILLRQQKYQEAIPYFEKSLAYFNKNAWVDRFRNLILLSSSRIPYREMALVNLAFCHEHSGETRKARNYYYRTLQFFPESMIAQTAIKIMKYSDSKEKVRGQMREAEAI